jgi:DNA-binding NarL/FixJ family response regulator
MGQRIFIVEDHPVMRQGYEFLIGQDLGLEICGGTGSADEARLQVPEVNPDLVIVDLAIKGGSGLDLIKDLKAQLPDLRVLVVSMYDESLYADRVIQAGARGYLMKNQAHDRVNEAIHKVLDGGIYLSQAMRDEMLLKRVGRSKDSAGSPVDQLSDRELEVFEFLGQGLSTREIAEHLMLSTKTVNSYRLRLREKLGIDTNAELRRRAVIWLEHEARPPDALADD